MTIKNCIFTWGRITLMLVSCLLLTSAITADESIQKGKRVIYPFNYKNVTLENGDLSRQFTEVCEYYLRIPNDDLLKPYRERAGKSAPGVNLGGCYIGHNPFGQIISGYARMYAATGDRIFKDKAVSLINGWAECIEPDGFFFAEKDPQIIPYLYEKMVCALVDVFEFCGDKSALDYLSKITDWADKNISRARQYANPVTNDGGEWYTLSENLYRAYLLTGNKKYKEFAKEWEYREYWDFFANEKGNDIYTKPGWYHAYSHVNTFCSLGAGYLVEGDSYYLDTLIKAYDYLQEYQCFATGGFGPNESLLPRDQLAEMLNNATNHFETQCGSWAGFKMTKYLISLTGDARFGDWTEKLILNGIGASIHMSGDGKPFYYSEYNTGGSEKRNINALWPCCSGTRPQAVSDYHDIIYFKDSNALYISLFTPSSVKMDIDCTQITLQQRTKFPESEFVMIDVHTSQSSEFAVKIRVPAWTNGGMKIWVNNEEVSAKPNDKNWAVINRLWSNGDLIKVKLPMKLWVSRMLEDKEFPAAIMYGPVAMAARAVDINPALKIDFNNVEGAFLASPADPLTWKLLADPTIIIKPFYAYKEGQTYFLYMDPAKDIKKTSYKQAKFSDGWLDFSNWMATNTPGSTMEYQFKGKGIRLHYFEYDDSGKAEVVIDGKQVGIVDQYGKERGKPAFIDYKGLENVRHTLRLIHLHKKCEESKGMYSNIAAFEIIE